MTTEIEKRVTDRGFVTLVRKPPSPFQADVLRGERAKHDGEWVEADELTESEKIEAGLREPDYMQDGDS